MMQDLSSIENERVQLQARLDAEKTAKDRNRLGQFSTPPKLADEILRYSLDLLGHTKGVRFLDPAIGTGSFYSALLRQSERHKRIHAEGFEIDRHYAAPAVRLWKSTGLQIHQADFTRQHPPAEPSNLYNLLVCNPPYVRHHHLSRTEKTRLGKAAIASAGIRVSGLAGLYAYFLMLSHKWMAEEGLAAWLIPSEFLDVNYGTAIKMYLLHKVNLVRIHRFEASDVQFDDALVTSSVIWFKKETPHADHGVILSRGGSIIEPKGTRLVEGSSLGVGEKWSQRFNGNKKASVTGPTFGDHFTVKRGIATGANKFFVLSPERIRELRLPQSQLVPLLPGPRFLTIDEVMADDQGNPLVDHAQFVIDSKLPEKQLKASYPRLWEYLETGKQDVAQGYLCQSREPWYSQEHREPPPFLCTYIGRGDSVRGSPFRFILNWSKAVATNVYLLIYPKGPLKEKLAANPKAYRQVLQILNGITADVLKDGGRVYGGGLHKLEPRELKAIPVPKLDQFAKDL